MISLEDFFFRIYIFHSEQRNLATSLSSPRPTLTQPAIEKLMMNFYFHRKMHIHISHLKEFPIDFGLFGSQNILHRISLQQFWAHAGDEKTFPFITRPLTFPPQFNEEKLSEFMACTVWSECIHVQNVCRTFCPIGLDILKIIERARPVTHVNDFHSVYRLENVIIFGCIKRRD